MLLYKKILCTDEKIITQNLHHRNCAQCRFAHLQICDFCIWKIICAADLRILCTTVFRTICRFAFYTFAHLHICEVTCADFFRHVQNCENFL